MHIPMAQEKNAFKHTKARKKIMHFCMVQITFPSYQLRILKHAIHFVSRIHYFPYIFVNSSKLDYSTSAYVLKCFYITIISQSNPRLIFICIHNYNFGDVRLHAQINFFLLCWYLGANCENKI